MVETDSKPERRPSDPAVSRSKGQRLAGRWLVCVCAMGGLSVAAGAFGAHALEAQLSPRALAHWETASHYALGHVAPVVAVAVVAAGEGAAARWASRAGWAFAIGVVLFSGSLGLLAVTGVSRLGMITPVGGLSLLLGWALLARAATAH